MRTLPVSLLLLSACVPRLVTLDDGDGDDGSSSSTSSTDSSGEPTSTSGTVTTDDPTDDPPDDTSSTSADTGQAFTVPADYGTVNECDSLAQDCPEGDKCVPYASTGGNWDDNKCVPVMGQQALGESCWYGGPVDATDDCDATGMCWNVNEEGVGTCHAFCMGTADDPHCPEGSLCLLSSEAIITLCIPTCDPIVQDCGAGLGCYWSHSDFSCIFTTQDLPIGAPCGFINDCAPGNICLDASVLPECMGSACCSNFCNIELGPGQCDALPGTECVAFWEQGMAPPNYEHIGVCIVMP